MIGFERLKLRRSLRPLLCAQALFVFLVLMLAGFYTYAQNRTGGQVDFRYTYENRSYFNGLTFALYAFYFASSLLLPIFAATEGGAQIAGETSSGTLQLLLTRPLSKSRIFLSKFTTASLYLFLLSGLFLGLCLTIGLFAVGWGELSLYPGVLQMTERPQHLDQTTALWRFLLAWPLATVGLWTTLAFGFLMSVWTRSAVNAASSAVALFLVMYVISSVHFFESLRPLLFTSHLDYWRSAFQEVIPWSELLHDGAKLAAFGCAFLAVGHLRFRTREEG